MNDNFIRTSPWPCVYSAVPIRMREAPPTAAASENIFNTRADDRFLTRDASLFEVGEAVAPFRDCDQNAYWKYGKLACDRQAEEVSHSTRRHRSFPKLAEHKFLPSWARPRRGEMALIVLLGFSALLGTFAGGWV